MFKHILLPTDGSNLLILLIGHHSNWRGTLHFECWIERIN